MPFLEIPRSQWTHFLAAFSKQHLGCTCSLEVAAAGAGPQLEARRLPFQGVVFEPGRNGATIQVFVGGRADRHVGHALAAPVGVWLDATLDGSDRGLRIEAASEGTLRLRFDAPQPSDQPTPQS
jgi:hypothetical protein